MRIKCPRRNAPWKKSSRLTRGGTEVAVAAFPGLYWRNEYRYAGYGSTDLQFSVDHAPTTAFNHESKSVQTITTSLIWKFH